MTEPLDDDLARFGRNMALRSDTFVHRLPRQMRAFWRGESLSLVLGGVSALGFQPLGLWLLPLIAFAVLIRLVARAKTGRAALALGYWFGVGHFVIGLNWIAGSFRYQETMPFWLGWVAVVVLSFYLALYPALAAGAAWKAQAVIPAKAGTHKHGGGKLSADAVRPVSMGPGFRRDDISALPLALFFAAAWIVTEWMRATVFTGFAWNPLSVAFVDAPVVSRLAVLIGTYGLSGFMVLIAAIPAFGIAPWLRGILAHRKDGTWPTYVIGPPVVAIAGVLIIIPLMLRLAGPDDRIVVKSPPLLRIIQPNIGQQDKYRPGYDAVNFRKLEELTGKPGPVPRLILWPEAAIPDYLETEEWARARVASLIGPKDMLLTGGTALMFDGPAEDGQEKIIGARNAVFAVTPGGDLIGRYDKAHLVPYGEYLALRWLLEPLGATRLVPGDIDFIPGPGAQSLAVPPFGRVGVQICYEIIFSGQVIDRANRPSFLFNPSNDAWFGTWGPPQHLAQARLRAIEEGLPVIRSTPTGISAVIDAGGRIIKSLPYQKAGFIEARLPNPKAPTPFARYGNLLPLAFAALLALIAIALRRRAR